MNAVETTIEELYSKNIVYVTPTFQRSYAYFPKEEEVLIQKALSASDDENFLGALITRELQNRENCAKALLIDGNRRLMTILILLLAIRDHLREISPEQADALDQLCFRNSNPHFPYKNIVGKGDRSVFERCIENGIGTDSSHPIYQTYRLAAQSFSALDKENATKALTHLLQDSTFVVLSLTKDDDPYPIFKLVSSVDTAERRIGLDTYRQFKTDPELMEMIAGGESQLVEFKAHSIVIGKHGKEDGSPQGVGSIVRAAASMLNSTTGGTLLIGVEDNGAICGIENEYPIVDKSKANWDGYQLRLANILRARLSANNAFMYYKIERKEVGTHDICQITISPSPEPVYIDKRLYVRTFNQTIEMLGPDLISYVENRYTR